MKTFPFAGLLALSVLGCLTALMAGLEVLAILLAASAIACTTRRHTRKNASFAWQPRPTITYLLGPRMDEPLIRLERGQTATVPWPHPLQILEATPERVRVMAA